MESVTRKVNVKNRGASVSAFAREHYLRRDLPCRSELCFENCNNDIKEGATLPKDVTHYLVRNGLRYFTHMCFVFTQQNFQYTQGWGRYFQNVSKIQIHKGLYLLYLSDT